MTPKPTPKPAELPNREILQALLDGKVVQFRYPDLDAWFDYKIPANSLDEVSPLWPASGVHWRVKPRGIDINGFDVPEPIREFPPDGELVWYPSLSTRTADPTYVNEYLVNTGVFHLTEAAAALHLKALLSFTGG